MSFIDKLDRARVILERQGRLSARALARELEMAGDELDELIEELVDVQQVARREGKVLVWAEGPASRSPEVRSERETRPAAPAETRKVVSIIFADLIGSTSLHERLDAESARHLMERYYAALRAAVEFHGGTVVKLLGDGVMAAFGVRQVAEDDALRAVHAAVAMQDAFRALAREQGVLGAAGLRVAVNTGEVVVGADDDVIGDPVNIAARLQEQGRDGEVVVGETTRRLVAARITLAPLGSVTLKGRAEAVAAYRVVSLEAAAVTAAPFVGREEELTRLGAVYETAVSTSAARLAVLLGSPGLGKSRLIEELARRHADSATVILAQCDAAGGATFAPLAEAVRALLGLDDAAGIDTLRAAVESALPTADTDRGRIAAGIAALLAGSPASPEETFFVVRRFLAGLAATKPVVLVIDDLHWAEPLLLDLVEHLVQWGGGVPLLVLVGARPELRELRSSLVMPGPIVADVVTLAGLDAGAAMRLAANVIGAADLPAAVAAKVLAASEGNPLFVGELVRMLVQEGALTKEGERWVPGVALASLEMPPTIHALLAARIERLRPEERGVLERAAVVGRHFSRSAVAHLMPRDATDLDGRLESLQRSELIERDTGWLLGEPVLRFHHVLIRDAAYRRLLKGTRADLHVRLADWIEAQVGDAPEHDETIGWHFEQAHQFLRELGPLDAGGVRLGERAATRLAVAGRRALARDDLPVAADLLGRAVDRLGAGDAARADLALDWCEALLAAGDVGPAANAIAELARFLPDPSDLAINNPATNNLSFPRLSAWHACFAGQLLVLTAPDSLRETADAVAAAAAELAALGDAAGQAKAHFVHALALSRLGKVGACENALDQALAAARRAGDRRRANTVLAIAPLAALWGPSPVTRASGRCLDVVRVLRITQGAPAVEAVALSCQGVLEALRGRTEAARRMIASARKMVEELGITQRLLEADVFGGLVELLEGDAAAAERSLRGAYEGLRDLGLGIDAARAAALLARALLAQQRVEEAEALSHESEALAGDDLKAAIAWRGVRAEALARRGEHAAAVEFASKAVELAAATDALLDHADARLALAAALRAAGRGREADAEERQATELWEAKGATLLAERARSDHEHGAPVAAPAPESVTARPALRRRLRPNVATAMQTRFDVAVAARDFDAIAAIFHESHEEIDHPTGSAYGPEAAVASLQRLFRSRDPHYEVEPLATLGEFLLLVRRRTRAAGAASERYDVGAYENEAIQLFEVDERGLSRRSEVFAADRLGDAIARLYERYAELLSEGSERERAAAVARFVATATLPVSSPDHLDRLGAVLAPDFEGIDHRHLSTWSMSGAEAYLEHLRALRQVGDNIDFRQLDILALQPAAMLLSVMHSGTERQGGGVYERPFLSLFATDAGGRLARAEWFDADREAEALARFDALVAGAPGRPARRRVSPNAATALAARVEAAFASRDDEALAALTGESLTVVDHPTGATYGRDGHLDALRRLGRASRPELAIEPLATLGETLALCRRRVTAGGTAGGRLDVGAWERAEFVVFESDVQLRIGRIEIFASDRLADAIAHLYARRGELLPEGPARDRAAGAARALTGMFHGLVDRERLANPFSPAVECVDHRLAGFGTLCGDAAVLEAVGAFLDLVRDARWRADDVLALSEDFGLTRATNLGTDRAGGGAFEREILSLVEYGSDGRIVRWEPFEVDDEAAALARFDELARDDGAEPPAEPFENAASRADRRLFDCFHARDWAAIEALAAPELVFDERRRMLHNTCGREVWLEQFRLLFDVPASRFTTKLLATRGERLSLSLHGFAGEVAGGGGPLAMDDHLVVHEVDGDGRILAIVLFDLDDEDAAYGELDARFESDPDAPQARVLAGVVRGIAEGDWSRVVSLPSPAFVQHDHRPLSLLGTTRGAEGWTRNLRTLVELVPDTIYRAYHVRSAPRGIAVVGTWHGTREGGGFEIPNILVLEMDERGAIVRSDLYEPDQREQALARLDALSAAAAPLDDVEDVDRARARFEEIRANEPGAPRAAMVKPNAANAVMDRWQAAFDTGFDTGGWDGMRALCAPEFTFDDRRRLALLSGDRELMIASARERVAMGARPVRRPVGTAGERVAIEGMLWSGGPPDGRFEIEYLGVIEVDESGLFTGMVMFDPDDARKAQREAWARWAVIDPIAAPWLELLNEATDAWNARDPTRLGACFADDVVVEDHRHAGFGRVEGADAYIESNAVLWDLAPDQRLEFGGAWPAVDPRCLVATLRREGTLADGGAFESEYVWLSLAEGARITRLELFESEALDEALARFETLRPPMPGLRRADPGPAGAAAAAQLFANAATATSEPVIACLVAHDWAGFSAHFAESFRCLDRRRMVQLDFDRDGYVAFTREVADGRSARGAAEILATRGDRLALVRSTFVFTDADVGPSEIAFLLVTEVDRNGRIVAYVRFDDDDPEGAWAELDTRWEAGEVAAHPLASAWVAAFRRAFARRDWEAMTALQAPAQVAHNHRLVGWGTLRGAGAWTRTLEELVALAPDVGQRVDHLRTGERGSLWQLAWHGTRDGGGFETPLLLVCETDDEGRQSRLDVWDLDHVDAALARWAAVVPKVPQPI